MLTSSEFVDFILGGPQARIPSSSAAVAAALPKELDGFDTEEVEAPAGEQGTSSFARQLLLATRFFGQPEDVSRASLIRSADAVARYLPERASYWPKTAARPYQTLLFEESIKSSELLKIPAFRNTELQFLDDLEAALARLVSEALDGFQRGGEGVTADVRKGRKQETLCIVSIIDEREVEPVRLICFGTWNKGIEGGLETFQISEQTRLWKDKSLAREYLVLLYERQFKKLASVDWQDAFTTTEERKQAEKLLDICTRTNPTKQDIQESVLGLLETIAKTYGLQKRKGGVRRLEASDLPAGHDIGMSSDQADSKTLGVNPFRGVTLRHRPDEEKGRLLGYIVYPLKTKEDAALLRKHLSENNRFHNVLVVYPDAHQASLELWQGQDQLTGKLRKQQGYRDAADVVNLLSRFFVVSKAKVRKPTQLAQQLAYRAQYLRRLAAKELEDQPKKGPLRDLYNAFKEALVHDQKESEFADAFAQTLTYGLLTARWIGNDQIVATGERFSRHTAQKHLPPTSPFLTDLFRSVLSVKFDEQRGRLFWLVDDIADLLDRIDVTYVFGPGDADSDKTTDPVIHFYEPFLGAYDKKLKEQRGVYFTPNAVVSYIVRSVHELLQTKFALEDGLASVDTWGEVAKRIEGLKLPEGVHPGDPFVCILDPATGTGTFLFECIGLIERTMKDRWSRELGATSWSDARVIARWNEYVPKHLLPRLYGYELMVASYAVAHLKLSFKIGETGYRLADDDRLHVYLTNSLEGASTAANPKLADLFGSLATQAQVVDRVKRSHRFTVVIGNPPYAGRSSNNGDWARALVDPYRWIGTEELRLAQKKWLQNDYVKFIALAETTLARSNVGVMGLITDNSYLDGDTFPGMRHHLLGTFSGLEVLDLHGSLMRRELPPQGGSDQNVFEIKQGVAILVGWTGPGRSPTQNFGRLSVADLWGDQSTKFSVLGAAECRSRGLAWQVLSTFDKRYLFVATGEQTDVNTHYAAFDSVETIFSENGRPAPGFLTTHDKFAIAFTREEIIQNVTTLVASSTEEEARREFKLCSQEQWQYHVAKAVLRKPEWRRQIRSCLYRPFDCRWTVYDPHVLVHRRERVNSHLLEPGNLALLTTRMTKGDDFRHVFVTDRITEVICLSSKTSANAFVFPLFLRGTTSKLPGMDASEEESNIAPKILRTYRKLGGGEVTARAIFFYCYAVLHSPAYRARYNALLIREFPRIPRPASASLFRRLAAFGAGLVDAHLAGVAVPRVRLCGTGDNVVAPGMPKFDATRSRIAINAGQYFDSVAREVWDYKVGSYDVCKKWLSERGKRVLTAEECDRFSAMVGAIETSLREQAQIDHTIEEHGGWPGAFVTTREASS